MDIKRHMNLQIKLPFDSNVDHVEALLVKKMNE